MDKDEQYAKLINAFGKNIEPLLMDYQSWSPPTVHGSAIESIFGFSQFPLRMTYASNSWVVSPKKSKSGKAIHASDPHLVIDQIPAFWYLAGLHSRQGSHAIGVTVPGLPMVAMGHTGKIAYSFTVASVDVIDYYKYKRDLQDSLQIVTDSGGEKMRVINEKITVKGLEEPINIKIYFTPAGVVVESDSQSVTAVRWAGFDFSAGNFLNAAVNLIKVDNFEDFRKTVTNFGALDVNWTYSDINGNIGYQLGTPIPKRDFRNTFVKLPGDQASYKWKEYYPLNETPYLMNPAENWLASCNNQIVSDKWPYDLPGFYASYRIIRISSLLESREKFSQADFEKIQLDQVSEMATQWKPLMAAGADKLNLAELAQEINNWDGKMSADEHLPALLSLWWEYLPQIIFEDDLGEEWPLGEFILEETIKRNLEEIIDNKNTAKIKESIQDISAIALDSAIHKLGNKTYGDICMLHIEHPLSQVAILEKWLNLNRGPFPMGGDFASLNANLTVYMRQRGIFRTKIGPSMRFVLDWADIDAFTINGGFGQSGNSFGPHYDDFLELWRKGERWNVPFSKERVFAKKKSLLKLIPAAD
jgi:penicillin amidase